MKILNLLTSGSIGGIETLCYHWGKKNIFENGFAFLTEGGPIYDRMIEEGFTTYDLFACGKKVSFSKLCKLIKIAKEYDIIIVHHGDPIIKLYYILVMLFTKIKGITMVHSCYDDETQIEYGMIKRKIHDWIFQKGFDLSKKVIFVSGAGQKSCQAIYSLDKDKCHVVYNGISEKIFNSGSGKVITQREPYAIYYIGRLNKIKGVDLLINAVAKLQDKYSITLGIVGDGEQRGELEMLADSKGIKAITTFYGAQTDITPYLEKAHVFVYPSTCQEVFGISIVEAMAYGIPCVANRVGGIPEIIEEGKNGYLTKEVSPDGISEAIENVIKKYRENNVSKMADYAKSTASRFTIDNNCNQIKKILEELCQK